MHYIICGLPGTGKTTMAKLIAQSNNCTYVNDWQIFEANNINILQFTPKELVSEQYYSLIINYLNLNANKNFVVDLEYSLAPHHFKNSNLGTFANIVYLGFVNITPATLHAQFCQNGKNSAKMPQRTLELMEFYINQSTIFAQMCKQHSLPFININKDKSKLKFEILKALNIRNKPL